MFSAISNFFKRQASNLSKAHAHASWEEALDTAVAKINALKDIESEKGKHKLGVILDELKLIQLATQENLGEQTTGDAESGD